MLRRRRLDVQSVVLVTIRTGVQQGGDLRSGFVLLLLTGAIIRYELIESHVASADPDHDLVVLDSDKNSAPVQFVNTFGLSQEWDLLADNRWCLVQDLAKSLIDNIVRQRSVPQGRLLLP